MDGGDPVMGVRRQRIGAGVAAIVLSVGVTWIVAAAANAASPPDGVDDAYVTPVNTASTGNVLDNDLGDPPLTVALATGPANGVLVLNADGTFTYTPATDFNGVDTFTYQVCDAVPACDPVNPTVTITVENPPLAMDDSYQLDPAGPMTLTVLANDTDPDGDVLTVLADSITNGPTMGTVVVNTDSTLTYTALLAFQGADRFQYSACDPAGLCDTAQVTVYGQILPVARNDRSKATEGKAVRIAVTLNDTFPVDVTPLLDTLRDPNHGVVTWKGERARYRPQNGFTGKDSFV